MGSYSKKCRFVDHKGITRTGTFSWSSKERKSKYRRDDTLTIYYKPDFNDGDEVWCGVFSSPNPAYYFWPWAFLLITLIIHIQKRIQRKKDMGNSENRVAKFNDEEYENCSKKEKTNEEKVFSNHGSNGNGSIKCRL